MEINIIHQFLLFIVFSLIGYKWGIDDGKRREKIKYITRNSSLKNEEDHLVQKQIEEDKEHFLKFEEKMLNWYREKYKNDYELVNNWIEKSLDGMQEDWKQNYCDDVNKNKPKYFAEYVIYKRLADRIRGIRDILTLEEFTTMKMLGYPQPILLKPITVRVYKIHHKSTAKYLNNKSLLEQEFNEKYKIN